MTSYMILGGQWGSEGKGLFAGYMAMQRKPDAVVSQFGPNAGHTWIEGDQPIVFKALPVGSVAKSVKDIYLGPGSVINPETLAKELNSLGPLLDGKRVWVHEAAAIVRPEDVEAEMGTVTHIASTRQGTSEAMIRKIRRGGKYPAHEALRDLQVTVVPHNMYRALIRRSECLQIEGSQGIDLSINSGYLYPYTTSRDCTPSQVLADCGLHPMDLCAIIACIRTYPIRVGNIVGGNGLTIGTSGPCYTDQSETSWKELGLTDEHTTVTKRVRRVFTFSSLQTINLLNEVKPTAIFLNFCNYMPEDKWRELMGWINTLASRPVVRWTGHGPKHTDIRAYESRRPEPTQFQE